MKDKIVVLIPSLNPLEEFYDYVKSLISISSNIELIIVNDGSNKEKEYIFNKISKLNNVTLLTHKENLGKGEALKTGFKYYLKNKKNLSKGIITADSDGQHSIKDILKIASVLNEQTTESLIIGKRNFNLKTVPIKSKIGNFLTRKLFKLKYKKDVYDTQSGLRGLTNNFIEKCVNLSGSRFEYEINVLIEASRENINIIEVNIETIYYNNNERTNYKAVKDSIKICKEFLKK